MTDNTSMSNSLTQEEKISERKFLDRPITKLAVRIISKTISEANTEPAPLVAQPAPPPTNHEVIRTILLAWLASGFGVLAIVYPHLLDSFDPHYFRGNDLPSILLVLVLIVLVNFLWTQIGGAIVIAFSLFAIAKILFQKVVRQQ